jgi:hypothetical protein
MTNISKYFSKNNIIVFSISVTFGFVIGRYLIKSNILMITMLITMLNKKI